MRFRLLQNNLLLLLHDWHRWGYVHLRTK